MVYPPVHQASSDAYPPHPTKHPSKSTLPNLLRPWGPCRYHLPPRNRSPWTPPDTRPAPVGTPQKTQFFFFFVRIRNNKNTTHVAKFAPSLGPVPLPPTPPEPKPLDPTDLAPPSQPFPDPFPWNQPGQLRYPPLTGNASKKTPFFFFLYVLETTKIRLRNLLRPWTPCTYHLPPQNRSPWTLPRALAPPSQPFPDYPPPPHRTSFKKRHFLLFVRVPSQPFPDPFPWNQGPWSTPFTRPARILQKTPFFFWHDKNTTHVAKFAPSLRPLPPTKPTLP